LLSGLGAGGWGLGAGGWGLGGEEGQDITHWRTSEEILFETVCGHITQQLEVLDFRE